MAMDFPVSPTNGQTYQQFYWDASTNAWRNLGSKNALSSAVTDLQAGSKKIATYDSATARNAAVTNPAEGMVSYLANSNLIEVYDGSAWKQISALTGNILQVVSATQSTQILLTSTSYITSNLSATITPKSSTSKILILTNTQCYHGGSQRTSLTIFRGGLAGTNLTSAANGLASIYAAVEGVASVPIMYVDSPATTSATSYLLAVKVSGGTGSIHDGNTISSMTLIEIAA